MNLMYPLLLLKKEAIKRRARRHPWIFSNELAGNTSLPAGSLVHIKFPDDSSVWTGYYNPHSLIAIRVLDFGVVIINPDWIGQRIESALNYRKNLHLEREAIRLIHGEADGLPGLIVDQYKDVLVVQSLTAGMDQILPTVTEILQDILQPKSIIGRLDHDYRELEGLPQSISVLVGVHDGPVQVKCHGVDFQVDLLSGQKTGLFLDQMENIQQLVRFAPGASVFDVCSYTGAFSLALAHQGAKSVTALDASGNALEDLRSNARLNNLDCITTLEGNAFDLLPNLVNQKQTFDLVNLDPPAFAKKKKDLTAALKGYRELNRRVFRLVRRGGILASSTCSHHVSPEDFLEMLQLAARDSGRTVRIIEVRGQASDHPVLLSAPETRYLTFVLMQVE
jgi:23S rRNA (cytosine1962-C5)-methyltransferase